MTMDVNTPPDSARAIARRSASAALRRLWDEKRAAELSGASPGPADDHRHLDWLAVPDEQPGDLPGPEMLSCRVAARFYADTSYDIRWEGWGGPMSAIDILRGPALSPRGRRPECFSEARRVAMYALYAAGGGQSTVKGNRVSVTSLARTFGVSTATASVGLRWCADWLAMSDLSTELLLTTGSGRRRRVRLPLPVTPILTGAARAVFHTRVTEAWCHGGWPAVTAIREAHESGSSMTPLDRFTFILREVRTCLVNCGVFVARGEHVGPVSYDGATDDAVSGAD